MDNTTSVAFPEVPLEGETAKIPLRARDGSVRAYAIVDAADAEFVQQWTWHLSKGYVARTIEVDGHKRQVRLHRELLGLSHGDLREGDHRNLNKLDNRRSNLRVIPHSGNMQNFPSVRGSSSRYRGVSWQSRAGKWVAKVKYQGKAYHLGSFTSETEAAEAARIARLRLMPYTVEVAVAS